MANPQVDKFPIVVGESGLHICFDDILTPMEAMQLIRNIQDGLFAYKLLTGKCIDAKPGTGSTDRMPKGEIG